ncbi:hypothetical protein B0A55_05477 [Friedmanniomyces simplex]|uniref:Uncharacterized protein n=1 Tax=Friedmanniomyces simplex TaxID=329884 RepID=A0A4U0XGD7_9PEZI|nr:hypothetical protein B0A55_05477 [Friedmanniomyces simplex]
MKFTTTLAAAGLAALVSAQGPIFNANGTFTCPDPQGAYCAGANIIIRCTNGVGQPGNCDDNLDGEPPMGLNYAPCFSCGANSSRSACSKNGIVYPGSGVGLGNVSFPVNNTAVCAAPAPVPAPYANRTTPGGPIANTTTPAGGAASTGGASPTGSGAAGGSGSGVPIPYTGAATSVQVMGAGAVLCLGMLFAALL